MGWEECVLFRKEKWSVCSGKHYCTAFPATAQVSIGRKGRVSAENWGKCLTQTVRFLCVYHNVRSGCVMEAGSFASSFRVQLREFTVETCLAINVPLEGR